MDFASLIFSYCNTAEASGANCGLANNYVYLLEEIRMLGILTLCILSLQLIFALLCIYCGFSSICFPLVYSLYRTVSHT